MRPESILIFCLILLGIQAQPVNSQADGNPHASELIEYALNEVVKNGKAPGMIAAIISSEGVMAIGAAGERKAGYGKAIKTDDKVHLGSCGKAMTSTMIATLVAEGKLSWDTKFLEIFPELKEEVHPDYYHTTLWQLLTHRAGFPDLWTHRKKGTRERRLEILTQKLKRSAPYPAGEFHYSNLGYVAAACMAERLTGLSWEALMTERLFEPMGMSSAGFGAPNSPHRINQPWGHHKSGKSWIPDQSDCAEVLSPAGRIHCNIEDWAKFLSLQLVENNTILDRAILHKLTEPEGNYAAGWGVADYDWAEGTVLIHNGSNGIWYSTVLVAPNLDKAYVVVSNSCDFKETVEVCNEITRKLVRMDIDGEPHIN